MFDKSDVSLRRRVDVLSSPFVSELSITDSKETGEVIVVVTGSLICALSDGPKVEKGSTVCEVLLRKRLFGTFGVGIASTSAGTYGLRTRGRVGAAC